MHVLKGSNRYKTSSQCFLLSKRDGSRADSVSVAPKSAEVRSVTEDGAMAFCRISSTEVFTLAGVLLSRDRLSKSLASTGSISGCEYVVQCKLCDELVSRNCLGQRRCNCEVCLGLGLNIPPLPSLYTMSTFPLHSSHGDSNELYRTSQK